jgi:OmpA-OmpF porin, OOP family
MRDERKHNMKTKLIIATAALTFTGAAFAADQGFYMGANVGASSHDVSGSGDLKENPTTWGVYGGYDFNKNFAIEAGYQDLGTSKAGGLEAKNQALSVDLVGKLPVTESINVYGKAGLAYVDRDITGAGVDEGLSGTAAKFGVGAEFKATKNVAVRTEVAYLTGAPTYESANGSFDKNATLFTMGVNYKF